ncbi:collagen-like repeat preface domain-containing protein [Bacillus sp. FSL R12-0069]|uniref:collagen-like repeat preface domain-containing protein n=1 Tax=Bacillus sp. FSL R12-0069 TaxID=2975342 RepID=UPI0030F4BCDA
MKPEKQTGPTGHEVLPVSEPMDLTIQAATIPITPVQTQQLLDIVTSLKDRSASFINNPNTTHKQELQQVLLQLYNLFTDYTTFPYESVAYVQFLTLEIDTILSQMQLFNGLPLQEGQVPQLLQQLFSALETLFPQLILDPATFNQLTRLVTSSMGYTANQPVTAAISLPPEQPQVLLNFFIALQTNTAAFFTAQTPTNNQNLQNLFNQFFTFLNDFQTPGYTQYGKFLSLELVTLLNQQPLCLGKITLLLQQFYSEMANFIERLIMPEGYYTQLTNLLAQSSAVSGSCDAGGGPTGPTGATGPSISNVYGVFFRQGLGNITIEPGEKFPIVYTDIVNSPGFVLNDNSITINIPGVYIISANILSASNSTNTGLRIYRNNIPKYNGIGLNGGNMQLTETVLLNIDQGDIVDIRNPFNLRSVIIFGNPLDGVGSRGVEIIIMKLN